MPHLRRWVPFVAALAVATPALAGPELATPDGRARVGADAELDGERGRAGVSGDVGALGFNNALEGDRSPDDGGDPYLHLTNPPMGSAVGTRGIEREELYGPPVARAALGTGGLTVGLTGTGVMSNLSWPGPGYWEHVNHVNVTRDWANHGAPENAGSFAGLALPDGSATWFTPTEGWHPVEQAWEGPSSGVLRTVLARGGVTVTIRDVVDPQSDVLARHLDVTGAPEGSSLLYYANMNPTTGRVPRVPSVTDGLIDNGSDHATAYDAAAGVMLHLRPYSVDPAATTAALTGQLGAEPTTDAIDRTFGDGVYVAIGGETHAADHQAGLETVGLVRQEGEGTALLDPYYDARDGDLSGSSMAVGKTAGAQRWPGTTGTVYIAAAGSASEAAALVAGGRSAGFEQLRSRAELDWAAWTSQARLPDADPVTVDVARRALMLIRTAQDRRTGAIVANTTTQTPYRQDWVRDGAFFNYALLAAGYSDMVARHNAFYRRAQSATGHWDPILCTDGAHCSAVFPFEIDAQALGVWSQWMEYEFDGDLVALGERWESIRAGAEVLWACHDPTTGLQCYAAEDDAVVPSQGMQGASTTYLGLVSAARAADLLGHTAERDRWRARAEDLRAAARARLCGTTCPPGRGGIYAVWPSRLLVDGEPHAALQPTLDAMGARLAERVSFSAPAPGGFFQYPMEAVLALATAWQAPDAGTQLDAAVSWLTHDVVEPGVLHYGERIFHLGEGRYLHTVGFPHVWSGAEVYLAAALVHGVSGCPLGQRTGDVACTG